MATKVNGKAVDPVRKLRYEVYTVESNWIPKNQVGFSEVSGLGGGTTAEEEYADGNDMVVRKIPGRTKYGDVTMKKGVDAGDHLMNWRNATNETLTDTAEYADIPISDIILPDGERNPNFRANLFVELYDRSSASGGSPGKLLKRWLVQAAWPKDLQVDALNSVDGGVLYETVTLSVERVILTYPKPRRVV